ncbi:hypothetical protein B0H14DRAFT_210108 [Mycena olivaceomarginata]|nr:hypothetical protein B0H14DRAFT_210108 [Mycena olivaceomarginata]
MPEILLAEPGRRTVTQRSATARNPAARRATTRQPSPAPEPRAAVQAWGAWTSRFNLPSTPPEPTFLVPDSTSPRLFGPRSSHDNPYSAILRNSSSSPGIWQSDPNLGPWSSVRPWGTWSPSRTPLSSPSRTPLSVEPILLGPESVSPGFFGPRSSRDDPYSTSSGFFGPQSSRDDPYSTSPGFFGPQSSRDDPYSATFRKSSSSPGSWQPDPNPSPASSVRSWATWSPSPTPPSVEQSFLARTPRRPSSSALGLPETMPTDTLPKSSSSEILGRSELFKVDADDSMTSFVDDEVPTIPPIPLPSAADIPLSPLIDNVDMPSATPPGSPPAIVQRKRQHNVAFGDNEDLEEGLVQRGRPRLREASSTGEAKLQKCEGDEQ